MTSLKPIVQRLSCEGQDLLNLKLAFFLNNNTLGAEYGLLNCQIKELLIESSKKLWTKLLSFKNLDVDFAYNLLLLFDQENIWKLLDGLMRISKNEPHKLKNLAVVGLKLSRYYKNDTFYGIYKELFYKCKWWNKANSTAISYKNFILIAPEILLEKLIINKIIDVHQLSEFCGDFQLDLRMFLIIYLKQKFLHWEPDYEVSEHLDGRTELIVKNDEHHILRECEDVLDLLSTSEITTALTSIFKKINFYHYETLICIINILSKTQGSEKFRKQMLMLLFLKKYMRVGRPTDKEQEQWFSTFPNTREIEKLSQWRLPYLDVYFTEEIFGIIKPELKLKTYRLWFELTNMWSNSLNKDDICMYAVKDVVSIKLYQL